VLHALRSFPLRYTDRIVQIESSAPAGEPLRPKGVGTTALIMCAFLIIDYADSLFRLSGGTLAGLFRAEHAPRLIGGPVVLAVVFFLIWNYWQGENWARISVLVWSFLLAAEELSNIVEHNGSLTAVMNHPLSFLKFAVAAFLLYWLNTRPLRSWFKHVSATVADLIADHLAGKLCTAVERVGDTDGEGWKLIFEHDAELALACPWRIVLDDNLAFASTSAPDASNAEDEIRRLVQNLRVKAVRVTLRTSDLFVTFEMGLELQTWSGAPKTHPSKAKLWKYADPVLTVVADSAGLKSQSIAAAGASGPEVNG